MEIYSIKRKKNYFEIIDQTLLPTKEQYITIKDYKDMIKAIKKLRIRGAPAIGIAAVATAYLACEQFEKDKDYIKLMPKIITEIEQSRPTAVNLFFATQKLKTILKETPLLWKNKIHTLVDEFMSYEMQACENMAINAINIIPKEYSIFLTHCNTGSLATYGIGTALGVIRKISENNIRFRDNQAIHVYVDETRPLLQGSRLTMWELIKSKIDCTLITDNMAAKVISSKGIQAIITGADRIASNGDTANKIGTYNLSILAKHFKIPFYIVAPETTIDKNIKSGKEMIIEERNPNEIIKIKDQFIAPEESKTFNPAFDVTPNELITTIITDKKAYTKPFEFDI